MGICYQNQKTNNSKLTKTTKIQTAQNLCKQSTLRLIGGLKTDSKKRKETNTKRTQKITREAIFRETERLPFIQKNGLENFKKIRELEAVDFFIIYFFGENGWLNGNRDFHG